MNNPKVMNQNSFDTVIMPSSRRLSRATCDTSINCSQQSILNAIERFVKSVENMDSTVSLAFDFCADRTAAIAASTQRDQ